MARNILAAIQQIKSDVAHFLSPQLIREACAALGHSWRQRCLDPVTTVHLFLLQMLHRNTACSHVPLLGNVPCSGEAYCQARKRLPLRLLQYLFDALRSRLPSETLPDEGRWHGHRTFLVDGTGLSMPDTPALQEAFGQPGGQQPGCGFPVLHLLALFHAASGYLLQVATAPLRTHDLSQVRQVHPELQPGDILVGDRGFCSYAHLALLSVRGVFGLFRVHQRQIVHFGGRRRQGSAQGRSRRQRGRPYSRRLRRLGRHDQVVEYVKPAAALRPSWLTEQAYAALPETLVVREIRHRIEERGRRTREVTLVTTLLDPERYAKEEVAALYGQRWQIELNFRHLKQTLGMDELHSQSVEGVQKEVLVYALVYNLVRLVMLEAARRQGVAVERISFIDAMRWLAESAYELRELRLRLVPWRPERQEPRAVKRRPKQYPRLNQPRQVLRKLLENQAHVA